jgi:hypothetical protein
MGAAAHSAGPDDPGTPVRPDPYKPVISGTKTYRPVEPLPWGDVNRRVAPKDKVGKEPPAAREKGAPEAGSEHKD